MRDPNYSLTKLILLIPFFLFQTPTVEAQTIITPPAVLNPVLVPVCTCESGKWQGSNKPEQYDLKTGKVLHGKKNPKDIGACQINEYWNGEDATAHGWDIYTLDGNIRMANYLYKTQGLGPWSSSQSCWES